MTAPQHTEQALPWQNELGRFLHGDVQFDDLSRALYATDASIYQVNSVGVVLPRDEQDVALALQFASGTTWRCCRVAAAPASRGRPLVGRSISISPNTCTAYSNSTPPKGWAWVEPGLVLDHLNAAVAAHGLQFAPDVSTSSRATLGGMIANNSAGMYSVVYGKTIDHVLELRVMLADGTITTFAPTDADEMTAYAAAPTLAGRAYETVQRLAQTHAAEIEARYPKVIRRVGGYNLDAFTGDRPTFNMAHMIVGSEGTLAIILAAKVRLIPRPAHTVIGIAAFPTVDDALAAVVPALACRPSAVELIDDILLDLTRRSLEYAQYLASFVQGEPGALLQVEVFGATVARSPRTTGRDRTHAARPGTRVQLDHSHDCRRERRGAARSQSRIAAASVDVVDAAPRNLCRGFGGAARTPRGLCQTISHDLPRTKACAWPSMVMPASACSTPARC